MSAFIPDVPHAPADAVLPLTGERTIPGLDVENYWLRRHEVVYQRLTQHCADREVLEAGCGEGYGADLIAGVARRVIALDYDEATVAHVRARYPRGEGVQGNLAAVPRPAPVASALWVGGGARRGGGVWGPPPTRVPFPPWARDPDQSVPHPRAQC